MTGHGKGTRAVIYVRESEDKWGDGRAIERFTAQCRELCDRRGLTVTRVLADNDVTASKGNKGEGYAELLRLMRAAQTDYVVVPVVDRMVRTLRDLEDVIDAAAAGGVTVLGLSGDIDLSHDQGRLIGRILAAVAKGETERKGARQSAAAEQSAVAGRPRLGCPRPFGWEDDRAALRPAEAAAIAWAAGSLLGGGTVAGVAREWNARGLVSTQARGPFTRQSVLTILRSPRLAGLSTYKGEVVGAGQWEPVLSEAQWRAVGGLLSDPSRKAPRGAYTLLGGLALCRCGTVVAAGVNRLSEPVYRCDTAKRGGAAGPHCQQRRQPVDDFTQAVITGRLARDDIAALIAPPPSGPDPAVLRREAAAIRANLGELAADRALGLVTRAQMLKATQRGGKRLAEIAAGLAASAGGSALAPFAAIAGDGDLKRRKAALELWNGLGLDRKRAVIAVLTPVIIRPAGRGARVFDPETIKFPWRHDA